MARVKRATEGEYKGEKKKCVELTDNTKVFLGDDTDIEELLYSSYAKKLTFGSTNKGSWLETFIDSNLDALKKHIKDDPSTSLSAIREINRIASATQEYYNKKKETNTDFSRYLLRECLFPWQKKFYDDTAKKITLLAGRRSGKSYSIVEKALKHCLLPPIVSNGIKKKRQAIIIGLTIEKTASIYWQNIKDAIEKAHINTTRIDNGTYTVTFTNGNTLFLYGNNSKADREKLRGFDLSFVAIDECQSQQALLYMIDSILMPQLKGTDGELALAGTAPISAGTYWEQAVNSETFSHHRATMEDNPSIPDHEHALENVLKENHWTPDNITYRREYLGEIAYDNNLLIYPYVTYYDELPENFKPVKAYVGMDLGWTDKSAIETILIDAQGNAYLTDEFSEPHCTSSFLLEKCFAFRDILTNKWKLPKEDIYFITDTNEQNMTRDFYNKGLYELSNVRKKSLEYSRTLVNEAMESGVLKIKKNGPADEDHNGSVYKFDIDTQTIIYEEDKSNYHSNAMEAVRYAWQTYIEDSSLSTEV